MVRRARGVRADPAPGRAQQEIRAQEGRAGRQGVRPEPLDDDGVLLRAPLVEGLAAAVVRLARAVKEYDQRVLVLVGFAPVTELDDEEEELYREARTFVSWSLTEMHGAARDAAEVLWPALLPPNHDEGQPRAADD